MVGINFWNFHTVLEYFFLHISLILNFFFLQLLRRRVGRHTKVHFELPNCLQRLHLEYRNPAEKKVHNMVSKWCEIHHNLRKYIFPWNHNVAKSRIYSHIKIVWENVDFAEFLQNNGASRIMYVLSTLWIFPIENSVKLTFSWKSFVWAWILEFPILWFHVKIYELRYISHQFPVLFYQK